jgi:hypothetical protein
MSTSSVFMPFASALLLGCSAGGASHALVVGNEAAGGSSGGTPGGGGGIEFADDASASNALSAHVESPPGMTVTFVTLSCSKRCADVLAVAKGGFPPYTYKWEDGSPNAPRRVCPGSTTNYVVTVTDSGSTSAELARPPQTKTASLTADVVTCPPDGGATPTNDAGACDSVAADFSPAGMNPSGPWSYGFSASLGSAFSPYTTFVSATNSPTQFPAGAGLAVWVSSLLGNPAALFNPTAQTVVVSGSMTFTAGQFGLHPGPLGEYSIARWTAREAGLYRVEATFEGVHMSQGKPITTTDVHVQHDSVDLASGSLNIGNSGNIFPATLSVTLAAGDTVDFAVGNGGNGYTSDGTGLDARVCKE